MVYLLVYKDRMNIFSQNAWQKPNMEPTIQFLWWFQNWKISISLSNFLLKMKYFPTYSKYGIFIDRERWNECFSTKRIMKTSSASYHSVFMTISRLKNCNYCFKIFLENGIISEIFWIWYIYWRRKMKWIFFYTKLILKISSGSYHSVFMQI